jgi:hypothetical protein
MSNKKEGIQIANPTILDWFVFEHEDEDTIIGDLCKDIRMDKAFPFGTDIDRQFAYLKRLVELYPWIIDAVEEFLKALKNYQRIII